MSAIDPNATNGHDNVHRSRWAANGSSHRCHECDEWAAAHPIVHRSPKSPEESDDPRWLGALEALRQHIVPNESYAPEVLFRKHRVARLRRAQRNKHLAVVFSCAIVLATGIGFHFYANRAEAHPWVTYIRETPQPDPRSLGDGSVFQLNDHARMRVNFTDAARRIVLDGGEAYFDVSPDVLRSFDVEAGNVKLVAKGTAFSVTKDDEGQVQTTVKRGVVEVQVPRPPRVYRGAPEESPEPEPDQSQKVAVPQRARVTQMIREIKAGEVAIIGPDSQMEVTEVGQTAVASRLAWADPVRQVDGMTLREAVELFNRYNVQKLVILDPELGKRRVSGRYHLTEPARFVQELEQLGIHHESRGPGSDAPILLKDK